MLELEEVTPENYRETLSLSVLPEQQHLVAPVVVSLADAYVWKALPRVARDADRLVGFVLLFPFEQEGEPVVNIVRFLIDQRFQGKGLGRELMAATLAWVDTWTPRPVRIRISTKLENARAERLYRAAGFSGDEELDGEIVLWRDTDRG